MGTIELDFTKLSDIAVKYGMSAEKCYNLFCEIYRSQVQETIKIPYSAMPEFGPPFTWKGLKITKVGEQLWQVRTSDGLLFQSDKKLGDSVTVAFVPYIPDFKENSAHSFTEGMDIPKANPDDPQFQIGQLFRKKEDDEMIKSLIGSARLVDIEKVLSDLIRAATSGITTSPHEPAIQNAEAALGMLQAFKEKRVTPKDVVDDFLGKQSWSDFPKEMKSKVETYKEIVKSLPYLDKRKEIETRLAYELDNASARGEAAAIMSAIEHMLKLHGTK